ncbi:hypothetical protein [Candidatus Leptofilum sp.]|uniref:hypothetical protein n=1 Tax=Candidatus Leptofilum sp. TaxID=3241576 RepID=UPI003B5CE3FE
MSANANFDLNLTSPASYQIKVKGELDARWGVWFEGMEITAVSNITILSGTVVDQTALHSLLTKIRDLGLPLISVNLVSAETTVE